MENIDFDLVEKTFRINGFPDAVKVARLDGALAKRLTDIALHIHDLEFSQKALKELNFVEDKRSDLAELLWRSAIVYFIKCFTGNSSRTQISEDKILKSEPHDAKLAFRFFKSLRDKYFIHDENNYSQCVPMALINNGQKAFKIEKIICQSMHAGTLDQGTFSNLTLLVEKSLEWVRREFDLPCDKITALLEAKTHQELMNLPVPEIITPDLAKIDRRKTGVFQI
jgi:hypothetical protein